MKNIKLIMFCSLFFLAATSFGQERIPTCTNCEDPKNNITDNGDNTFTATDAQAQAYYWEICQGSASISGLNTEQNVTVTGTPGTTGRITLTRFKNGNCYESCEEFIIIQGNNNCEDCITIAVETIPGVGCTGAVARLKLNCQTNVASVDWFWSLNTVTNVICYPEPSCPIGTGYSPSAPAVVDSFSGDYSGYLLGFTAIIHYNDGTTCEAFETVNLNCPSANGGGLSPEIILFPNPSKPNTKIEFDGVDNKKIESIEIININGLIKSKSNPTKQSLNTKNLTSGIYFVRFNLINGEVIQKKLIIE